MPVTSTAYSSSRVESGPGVTIDARWTTTSGRSAPITASTADCDVTSITTAGGRRSALTTSWPAAVSPATTEPPEEAAAPGDQDLHAATGSGDVGRTALPHARRRQAGEDVVEAPPRRDQGHAAEAVEVGEDQHQPEAGVADADLEGHRLAAPAGQPGAAGDAVAERERHRVLDEDGEQHEGDVVR